MMTPPPPDMSRAHRLLYHQIHPLKLFVDVSTAAAASLLFWEHRPGAAMLVGFIPSIIVSVALVRWADLEPYRASAFGQYIGQFMTRRVEAARFAGLLPLWGGAWMRRPPLIVAGGVWIVGCWLWGTRKVIAA